MTIIYFTSTIDPATGDTGLRLVVEAPPIDVAMLPAVEPDNADPVLAMFYEPEDGE